MLQPISSVVQQPSTPSRGTSSSQKRGNDDESQRHNCLNKSGGNAISKRASPETEGSSPTAGHTLL